LPAPSPKAGLERVPAILNGITEPVFFLRENSQVDSFEKGDDYRNGDDGNGFKLIS